MKFKELKDKIEDFIFFIIFIDEIIEIMIERYVEDNKINEEV